MPDAAQIAAWGWVATPVGIVASAAITAAIGRRQRTGDFADKIAGVAAGLQDTYQDVIADLRAQVSAAGQEASSARSAARIAQQRAEEASETAWAAGVRTRALERFLWELRPQLVTRMTDPDDVLARLDQLAPAPTKL